MYDIWAGVLGTEKPIENLLKLFNGMEYISFNERGYHASKRSMKVDRNPVTSGHSGAKHTLSFSDPTSLVFPLKRELQSTANLYMFLQLFQGIYLRDLPSILKISDLQQRSRAMGLVHTIASEPF